MSVIKFLNSPFSRKQRKTKVARSQNMCTTPIYTFLRKIEQISDILQLRGWNGLKKDCSFCHSAQSSK